MLCDSAGIIRSNIAWWKQALSQPSKQRGRSWMGTHHEVDEFHGPLRKTWLFLRTQTAKEERRGVSLRKCCRGAQTRLCGIAGFAFRAWESKDTGFPMLLQRPNSSPPRLLSF